MAILNMFYSKNLLTSKTFLPQSITNVEYRETKSFYLSRDLKIFSMRGSLIRRMRPQREMIWRSCCERAKVRDARIHDIRHKALTDMAKKGYSLQEIAKAAGHTQISTTMRYTHIRAEDTKEALESLGQK